MDTINFKSSGVRYDFKAGEPEINDVVKDDVKIEIVEKDVEKTQEEPPEEIKEGENTEEVELESAGKTIDEPIEPANVEVTFQNSSSVVHTIEEL